MRSMVEGASRHRVQITEQTKIKMHAPRVWIVGVFEFGAAEAPSTALRAVPLPRFRGGG